MKIERNKKPPAYVRWLKTQNNYASRHAKHLSQDKPYRVLECSPIGRHGDVTIHNDINERRTYSAMNFEEVR